MFTPMSALGDVYIEEMKRHAELELRVNLNSRRAGSRGKCLCFRDVCLCRIFVLQ